MADPAPAYTTSAADAVAATNPPPQPPPAYVPPPGTTVTAARITVPVPPDPSVPVPPASGTPPPPAGAKEGTPPASYIPTTEVPDVIPPVPHAYPASSAPLPEGVEIATSTPSIQ